MIFYIKKINGSTKKYQYLINLLSKNALTITHIELPFRLFPSKRRWSKADGYMAASLSNYIKMCTKLTHVCDMFVEKALLSSKPINGLMESMRLLSPRPTNPSRPPSHGPFEVIHLEIAEA